MPLLQGKTRAISSAGERFPDTEEVTGSIPVSRTAPAQKAGVCGCSAAVAHHLAKVRVAGSNPVIRSIVLPPDTAGALSSLSGLRYVEWALCPYAPRTTIRIPVLRGRANPGSAGRPGGDGPGSSPPCSFVRGLRCLRWADLFSVVYPRSPATIARRFFPRLPNPPRQGSGSTASAIPMRCPP